MTFDPLTQCCVLRVYSVETGKLERSLKGSASDEGALLKVT